MLKQARMDQKIGKDMKADSCNSASGIKNTIFLGEKLYQLVVYFNELPTNLNIYTIIDWLICKISFIRRQYLSPSVDNIFSQVLAKPNPGFGSNNFKISRGQFIIGQLQTRILKKNSLRIINFYCSINLQDL